MTVEAISPSGTQDGLRGRALDTIRMHTLEAILSADEPLRTADVGLQVGERLGLNLTGEEQGGLSNLVRMVLDSDPLFSQSNRQWDLALRMGRAEADRRKPVERAIEDFTDLLGHPVEAHPVAVLVASVYGRDTEYYEKMIAQLLGTRPQFFRVHGNRIGITRWLLEITSDEPADIEEDNFADPTVLDPLRKIAEGIKAKDPAEFARLLVEKAGFPVPNRVLQYFTWRAFPDLTPQSLFNALFAHRDAVVERGPAWVTSAGHQEILKEILGLIRRPDEATELVAASAPTEEAEMGGILAPTTVRVSDEDLEQVLDLMEREARSYSVTELCQQALEAFPGSRTYSAVHDSLRTRMREDSRFLWVGFERFRVPGTIPPEVEALPPGMEFDEADYLGEEGAEVDKVVDPRDWKFSLDEQIQHYLVQDLGDDASMPPSAPPTRLASSPPLHHYVAGTRYLRNADRGFFPAEPDLVQVALTLPDGSRFDVWVNNRLKLVFGLKEFYDANLPWVGGSFTIERGEAEGEYRLAYSGDVEPLMDIPLDRLQQLLQLRAEAATEGLPLTEVVMRILKAQTEEIHFVTLFTQVNVVRRTRRAQLASILSGQRFFQQNAQVNGMWHYDEKRAAKAGKKKGTPKRREVYNEDDTEFEYD